MTEQTSWPELPPARLGPTAETLLLFGQIVGKVRLARTRWINHGWHISLRLTARGLATPVMPGPGGGLELEIDLLSQALEIRTAAGERRRIALASRSVATFYAAVLAGLAELGAPTRISAAPNETPNPIPFAKDTAPRAWDAAIASDYHRALLEVRSVFARFRSRWRGKSSPIQWFWGAGDLAVSRFSGRRAPRHPGGIPHLPDAVTREAYSHEVASAGFWPGGQGIEGASFYAYAYPTPAGFADAPIPPGARWEASLGEFILPYEAVRASPDPEETLLAFLHSAYEAAAELAEWDRAALECEEGPIGRPRPL